MNAKLSVKVNAILGTPISNPVYLGVRNSESVNVELAKMHIEHAIGMLNSANVYERKEQELKNMEQEFDNGIDNSDMINSERSSNHYCRQLALESLLYAVHELIQITGNELDNPYREFIKGVK